MNREAALIIGIVATLVAAAVEQLSGPGIIDPANPSTTILNVITILTPLIAAAITRYQVYSKAKVAELTGTTVEELATVAPPP